MVVFDIVVCLSGVEYIIPGRERDSYCMIHLLSDCCDVATKNNKMNFGNLLKIYGVIPETTQTVALISDEDFQHFLLLYEGMMSVKVKLKVISKSSEVTRSVSEVQNSVGEANVLLPIVVQNIANDEYTMTDDDAEMENLETQVNNHHGGENNAQGSCDSDNEFSDVGSSRECNWTDSENEETCFSRLSKELNGREFKIGPMRDIEFKVGDVFENVIFFREVLKDYTIKEGFEPDKFKNDKRRVTAKCSVDGCPWRIHASLLPDKISFQVKTYNPTHCCERNLRKNKQATSTWIAKKLERELRQNPNKPIEKMAEDLHDYFEIEVDDQRLYRAREKGKKKSEGDHASSFNKMETYASVVRKYNPGSMALLSFQDRHVIDLTGKLSDPIFKRFFLAFPAPRNGFLKACRPFIGLDGCFLKGRFKGMLLSAVTLDGNNGIIPLAIMVAEGESKDSWGEFLELLDTFIGQCGSRNLTFMSDRQKGILDALEKYFPNANSKYCAKHMYNNFQAKFPGIKLRSSFWDVVRATTEIQFQRKMDEIKVHHKEAYEWLSKIPSKHWALHTMPETIKSSHVCNNMSESFNSWLVKNRSHPILTLMENFRRRIMVRFSSRKKKALGWKTVVTRKVRLQLDTNRKNSRSCAMVAVGGLVFEVKDRGIYYVVNLIERECNCREWALSGIPCRHAICAIDWARGDIELYCDGYLTKETYLKAYSENIMPLPDESMWTQVQNNTVLPPLVKQLPGRPKKKRRRGVNEPIQRKKGQVVRNETENKEAQPLKRSSILHCGQCGEIGHNRRTCPNSIGPSSQAR